VLLGSLFVVKDGYAAMPLVIVAVTVTYVLSAWITPVAPVAEAGAPAAAPASS
jgi:hypothetical protein